MTFSFLQKSQTENTSTFLWRNFVFIYSCLCLVACRGWRKNNNQRACRHVGAPHWEGLFPNFFPPSQLLSAVVSCCQLFFAYLFIITHEWHNCKWNVLIRYLFFRWIASLNFSDSLTPPSQSWRKGVSANLSRKRLEIRAEIGRRGGKENGERPACFLLSLWVFSVTTYFSVKTFIRCLVS